jgi:uncharacterized membrane protein
MSNLESNKNLAGIGSILLIFPFVSIIGIILVFVGMKGLSENYKEPEIYHHALMGLLFGIIGAVAFAAGIILAAVIGVFTFGLGALAIGFGALVVVFVFYLLMAINLKQAFSLLAQKSGEQSFNTAGTLLLWGAILTIIIVGFFLLFIAWIFATIAFFSIKASGQAPQPYSYIPPPTPPVMQSTHATRYCPNCGAPVGPTAAFCPNCGGPLK